MLGLDGGQAARLAIYLGFALAAATILVWSLVEVWHQTRRRAMALAIEERHVLVCPECGRTTLYHPAGPRDPVGAERLEIWRRFGLHHVFAPFGLWEPGRMHNCQERANG
jgi:hypothetical protein